METPRRTIPGVFKTIDYWTDSSRNDERSQTIVEAYSPERSTFRRNQTDAVI